MHEIVFFALRPSSTFFYYS